VNSFNHPLFFRHYSYVVTHGNNERQVQAIARAVKEVANEQNIEVKRMEGYNEVADTFHF
jgi:ribosomal silencing factor RsfS